MSSPWITWAGGVRPVPSASIVDVQLRNGAFLRSCYASAFDWMHRPGRDSDVVLFRFSEFANPALAESGIEPKVIPESEKSFEQKFDEFAQAWKESVARVEKKFEWLSESLSRIAATMLSTAVGFQAIVAE